MLAIEQDVLKIMCPCQRMVKKPFNQEFYRKWIDALYGIYDIRKTEDYINKLNEEAEKEVIKNKSNSKKSTTKAKKTVTK